MIVRVVSDVLVETREGIIEHVLVVLGVDQRLKGKTDSVVDSGCTILGMFIFSIESSASCSASEALLLPVQVDSPKVLDAIFD